MATKWKNFRSRSSVKLVCFLLVLLLSFIVCNRFMNVIITTDKTNISPEILLADLNTGEFFFQRNMLPVYSNAQTLSYYKSENSIMASEHLKWFESTNGIYLSTPDESRRFVWLDKSQIPPSSAVTQSEIIMDSLEHHKENAISTQLREYRAAMNALLSADGLLYTIISNDGIIILDNTGSSVETFKNNDVYLLSEGGSVFDSSHPGYMIYDYSYNQNNNALDSVIYLAFSSDVVTNATIAYNSVKSAYLFDFSIIAAALVLFLALCIVLLAGAGRRPDKLDAPVQFLLIDKPFLDISLALVAGLAVSVLFCANYISYNPWAYRNPSALNLFFILISLLVVAPTLLWFISLAKHVKAGRFWRHTLIWFIPSRSLKAVKSLWVGLRLTFKVCVIGSALLFLLIFMGAVSFSSGDPEVILLAFPLSAITILPLLRFAAKLRKLEQSVQNVTDGDYSGTINIGGGELGRIAASINNISAGISNAVHERLKSERLKTELITNVSHDIRTPLTSIITYADLLKNEGLSCEKASQYLDILILKSQRLKSLTDELFEAAKAASGNIEVNITQLDLAALISQIMGELDSAVKDSNLEFRIRLPDLLLVSADGKLMWRVMENLFANVFKYSLPYSRVYVDAEHDGSFVRVDIKNISATELNSDPTELTERFKRGDDSRSDGGSGLGLSIVQSFIAVQGGKFSISIDGDLFKVSVYLPASNTVV